MKTYRFIAFLFLNFGLVSSGITQSFTVSLESDTVYLDHVNDILHCYGSIKNNTEEILEIDIVRIVNDVFPDWRNAMCVADTCYYIATDSVRTSLNPSEEIEFRSGFMLFDDTSTYIANAVYQFRNVNKTTEFVDIITYGVNELTIVSSSNAYLEDKLEVYPNPVNGVIYIETLLAIKNILVYTMDGNLVRTINRSVNDIEVLDLANGVYFLRIETKEGVVIKRFVKK